MISLGQPKYCVSLNKGKEGQLFLIQVWMFIAEKLRFEIIFAIPTGLKVTKNKNNNKKVLHSYGMSVTGMKGRAEGI